MQGLTALGERRPETEPSIERTHVPRDGKKVLVARARAVTLTRYEEVARFVGLDPYAMLSRAGLHPGALQDPENWLPAGRILSLLQESALHSGRDDFGILLGECRTFASLGPVSLLLKHEETVRSVIMATIEYRRLLTEMIHVELRDDGRTAVVEWNLIPGLRSSQGINLMSAIAYRIMEGLDAPWEPECIHFRHAQPNHLSTFRQFFHCPIEFDSSFDGMSCSSQSLDTPNRSSDPELAAHARRLLNLMPGIRDNDSMTERTRSTILLLIGNGQADTDGVARCLGIPVRTLQRRLIREGQAFSDLLNETRKDLAVRYLGSSSHPITTVAQMTGYSALSSFTRWFTSEFGMSPAKWRKSQRRRDELHMSLLSHADTHVAVRRTSSGDQPVLSS